MSFGGVDEAKLAGELAKRIPPLIDDAERRFRTIIQDAIKQALDGREIRMTIGEKPNV